MAEPDRQDRPDGQAATTAQPEPAADESLELLRRERADFLNYKRRVERERGEDRERGRLEVIQRLLPLLDDLDRALSQLPPDLETHPWARGVALSRQQLAQALRDLG